MPLKKKVTTKRAVKKVAKKIVAKRVKVQAQDEVVERNPLVDDPTLG